MSASETQLEHVIAEEREALRKAGRLGRSHWLVIALSLLLTVGIYQFAKHQVEEKIALRFERQADQIIELIVERLQKYEDALWAGVATIKSHGGEIGYDQWRTFADNLNLEDKYPGINGIGVIFPVADEERDAFLSKQRLSQPNFTIYPEHQNNHRLVITYIEPVSDNRQAVGLDVAHEANRLSAALRARDSGKTQITGPITLVQDSAQTPGFLFYAPYYTEGRSATASRAERFAGMVYAPFINRKLMEGTLAKSRRQVGISIRDGNSVLFDENQEGELDFDDNPLYTTTRSLDIYGRTWDIDIWATTAFRQSTNSSQPLLILLCAIYVDIMLIVLLHSLVRANRRATVFADHLTKNYQQKSAELQATVTRLKVINAELEQFTAAAYHDMREPLRTLTSFAGILNKQLGEQTDNNKIRQSLGFITTSTERIRHLLDSLADYNEIGRDSELSDVDCNEAIQTVFANLQDLIESTKAEINVGQLPVLKAYPKEIENLFENLLINAIKYRHEDRSPVITIHCEDTGNYWQFRVKDNGIGIEPEYLNHVFVIFKRLHSSEKYPGSGIGLANCKKIVELHGGSISVESSLGESSTFIFSIPKDIRNLSPTLQSQVLL